LHPGLGAGLGTDLGTGFGTGLGVGWGAGSTKVCNHSNCLAQQGRYRFPLQNDQRDGPLTPWGDFYTPLPKLTRNNNNKQQATTTSNKQQATISESLISLCAGAACSLGPRLWHWAPPHMPCPQLRFWAEAGLSPGPRVALSGVDSEDYYTRLPGLPATSKQASITRMSGLQGKGG